MPDTMDQKRIIRFYLNERLVELTDVSPLRTVLDFLRLDRGMMGTKEGCAEGDCGACTVLVGRLGLDGALTYVAVNACIAFLVSLDGTHLVTIEHLGDPEGDLHPVQQAMVDFHGSQCGFCTPGIVMSLCGHWLSGGGFSEVEINGALQGNLCRCTGYAPIVRAAQAIDAYGASGDDPLEIGKAEMARKLVALHSQRRVVIEHDGIMAILPVSADDLAAVLIENPDATVVAGATDVGLWVTKSMRRLPKLVFLSRIRDMGEVCVRDGSLRIGALASYSSVQARVAAHFPALGWLFKRIGGEQVRNAGTIGGNVANGSPIGDMSPSLIALGAGIILRSDNKRRLLPLEDFFIEYGRQDLKPGEFLEEIIVPLLNPSDYYAVYKVSKRFDEDISAVLGAFRISLDTAGSVTNAMIAYGGMAGIPKRARTLEIALIGRRWSAETVAEIADCLEGDFQPISDARASARYRMTVAKNLLHRFWLETTGAAVQLEGEMHG